MVLMTSRLTAGQSTEAANENALSSIGTSVALNLYLEVSINGESTHSIVSFVRKAGHLFVRPSDLHELGIELEMPARAADGPIDLDATSGFSFRLDETHQSIDFKLSDALRAPFALGRSRRTPAIASAGTGLVVNYDVFAQSTASSASHSSLVLQSEQRFFGSWGALSNSGIETINDDVQHYVRQATTFQNDDPVSLSSTRWGDTVSSSLSWSRPVRLGGVQWTRDFALRPDMVTFPIPQLGGSAALPSTVDLYINSVRQLSSDVPSGPFVINGAATITGAGLATLVVHDALGRTVSATLPLYIDSRLLAEGLSSFSVEAGALRFNYGLRSFDYEGHAVIDATYRYGARNYLTLETHVEASPQLANAGAGALLRMGETGVLNLSIAGSSNSADPQASTLLPVVSSGVTTGPATPAVSGSVSHAALTYASRSGTGAQAAVGYQYISSRFSVTAQTTLLLGNYADLAALGGTPAPRVLDQITASVPLSGVSTLGASLVHVKDTVAGRSSIGEFWYTSRLTPRLSTYINASHDFAHQNSTGISIGLSMDFGDRLSGFATIGRSGGHGDDGISLNRSADYGGGWEWSGQVNHNDATTNAVARAGYLGRFGEVAGTVEQIAGRSNMALDAFGGVLLMDGVLEPSRRLGAGFALVSTDGTPGVSVLHDNRVLGVTDGSGHLLVPDLNPYDHNNLAIDTLALPAEDKLPINRLDVTPRNQSGVLAHFPIEHYRAATVTLVDTEGQYLPAGAKLQHLETGGEFIVGFDGIVFIDDIGPSNQLRVQWDSHSCVATFDAPEAAKSPSLAYLGRTVCTPAGNAP